MKHNQKNTKSAFKSILAIDTSTHTLSISLYLKGQIFQHCHTVKKHANTMIESIDDLCKQAGTPLETIQTVALNHGPGSFTGLRVGIATAQALAHANQQEMIMVSGCELYAYHCSRVSTDLKAGDHIAIMLDAKLEQVYFAIYKLDAFRLPSIIEPEEVINPTEIACPSTKSNYVKYGPGWSISENKIPTVWQKTAYATAQNPTHTTNHHTWQYEHIETYRDKLSLSTILIDYILTREKHHKITTIHASQCRPNYIRHHVADTLLEREKKKNTPSS